jgi:hypothetical protein
MNGQREVCEVLVAGGARVGAMNKDDTTAAALAREYEHEAVALYLEGLQ